MEASWSGWNGRDSPDFCLLNASRVGRVESCVTVLEIESWEALRDGGPTNSVGAGRRFGFVFAVGDGLLEAAAELTLLIVLDICAADRERSAL